MNQITIANTGQVLACPPQTDLYQLLAQSGLMERPCGGIGCCGKCKVRLVGDTIPAPTHGDIKFFTPQELNQGYRLACLCHPTSDLRLELPPAADGSHITSQGHMRDCTLAPDVVKRLTPQGATQVLLAGQPIALEASDTTGCCYGIAVDIGTTTVVAALQDLQTGRELAVQSSLNSQNAYGQDVISRIHYAKSQADGLHHLQQAILKDLRYLCRGLAQQQQIPSQQVYQMTIAANTTMVHLLAGIDPEPLGRSPYQPAFTGPLLLDAAALDLPLHPKASIYCLPAVSAFVGGDITAGVLACEVDTACDSMLFLDIGTNGEMVLTDGHALCACSCAAGPALEGMNISCGVRAAQGAIDDVVIDGDSLRYTTIGQQPAIGLCGSGLLAAVAEMNRNGILHKSGRFNDHPLVEKASGSKRLVLDREQGIYLTQQDIRQVQLAKGAILSGIYTLLEACGMSEAQLKQVIVAGQFGAHLKATSLTGAGLIPRKMEQRIRYVGNTAKSGAILCLLSQAERQRAATIAQTIRYVELSQLTGYEDMFIQCMAF